MSAPTTTTDNAGMTSKDYYFDSYAHFGKETTQQTTILLYLPVLS